MGLSDSRARAMQRSGRPDPLDVYKHPHDRCRRGIDNSKLFATHARVPSL